eukprot:TRINITY_DN3643_c0_g1_i4.p1 TRINITY_DN3643_c0_g1~~TRINITY_DN3643_c0_g1_i4.p1  ORF type:complete len:849 (-),score=424.68 TRINITY_DN3643_c0_g1_i4:1-2244(-)
MNTNINLETIFQQEDSIQSFDKDFNFDSFEPKIVNKWISDRNHFDLNNLQPTAFVGSIKKQETSTSKIVQIAFIRTSIPKSLEINTAINQKYTFILAIRTSLDSVDPMSDAQLDWIDAMRRTSNQIKFNETNDFILNIYQQTKFESALFQQHVAAWENIFESNIQIEAQGNLAQIVNSALYYLVSNLRENCGTPTVCQPWSVSPGSLATNSYNGHVFWDSETWMFPPLLLLHPELARTMLDYRFNTRSGAAAKAISYENPYSGTMFAWESAFTGQETCPIHAPMGKLEQHINGDIPFAVKSYWCATHDEKWIQDRGLPLVLGAAEFWASRASKESDGTYSIKKVIPIDEARAGGVDNSIFTNIGAIYTLKLANEFGKKFNVPIPKNWNEIATKIQVNYDNNTQTYIPFDGYDSGGSLDTVMIGYPFSWPMSKTTQLNNMKKFAREDLNGPPGMQNCIYATNWAAVGEKELAASLFEKCYKSVTHAPFFVWTEMPNFGGAQQFMTGIGGFLQAIMNGFGGIRITEAGLLIEQPFVSKQIQSIKLNHLHYLGNVLDIEWGQSQIWAITLRRPEKSKYLTRIRLSLRELHSGKNYLLFDGETIKIDLTQIKKITTTNESDIRFLIYATEDTLFTQPEIVENRKFPQVHNQNNQPNANQNNQPNANQNNQPNANQNNQNNQVNANQNNQNNLKQNKIDKPPLIIQAQREQSFFNEDLEHLFLHTVAIVAIFGVIRFSILSVKRIIDKKKVK